MIRIYILRLSLFFLFVATVIFASLPLIQPSYAQEKAIVWERFDVDIVVNVDGTVDISEHQTIHFTRGTFTSGFREISTLNLSAIDQWSITDSSGNTYRPATGGSEPYTFTVADNGTHTSVRWYFPEIHNASETYTLRYTVHDALRFYDTGDQMWWKAIYGDRSFPVLAGRIIVSTPPNATIQEWAAYINEMDARAAVTALTDDNRRTVTFELDQRLEAGEEFEVRVQFLPGVVSGAPAAWQRRADELTAQREAELAYRQRWAPWATLGFGGLGLLLLFGGPAALYLLWYQFGRDKPVEMVADYLPEAPDELTPGLAGVLLDETVDMQDIVATIVDLARRKVISITEERQEGFFHTGTDFIYRRERSDTPLLPYEDYLLSAIFGKGDEVRLSDLKNKFFAKLPTIKQRMYAAATEAELFPQSPESVRYLYAGLGIAGIVIAFIVGAILSAAFIDLTVAAVLPGVGLGATALGLLILSHAMPRKTDHGSETAARWRAFKRYLANIDHYSDVSAQKEIWDRWLPYTIAFGIDKEYIRKFEAVDAPAPGWYIPSPNMYDPYRRRYYGRPWIPGTVGGESTPTNQPQEQGEGGSIGGGLSEASRGLGSSLSSMSAGLGALLSSASSSLSSRPASSSSGGGWNSGGGGWSGGGGGWSGGGSSGGGGGGGGSGGFK